MDIPRKIWEIYCDLYGHFGTGGFTLPEALSRLRISEPMCRKAILILRRSGLARRAGRGGRRVVYRVVPPDEAGMRMALRRPSVRYRELLRFFESIKELEWYIIGTSALNYYLPRYAPVLELGSPEPAKIGEHAPPHLRLAISGDVPKDHEAVEFDGMTFRIASVEDAIVQSYRNFPLTLINPVEIDYMAAVAMKIKGSSLDTRRFEELPPPAREHLEEVRRKMSFDPLGELEEMAELFLSASPRDRVEGLLGELKEAWEWGVTRTRKFPFPSPRPRSPRRRESGQSPARASS
jgi:hypothetical protein